MKTSWEKTRGKRVDYASVSARGVELGRHFGSGHTDEAGTFGLEAFLAGEGQQSLAGALGEAVLEEVLVAVRAALAPKT